MRASKSLAAERDAASSGVPIFRSFPDHHDSIDPHRRFQRDDASSVIQTCIGCLKVVKLAGGLSCARRQLRVSAGSVRTVATSLPHSDAVHPNQADTPSFVIRAFGRFVSCQAWCRVALARPVRAACRTLRSKGRIGCGPVLRSITDAIQRVFMMSSASSALVIRPRHVCVVLSGPVHAVSAGIGAWMGQANGFLQHPSRCVSANCGHRVRVLSTRESQEKLGFRGQCAHNRQIVSKFHGESGATEPHMRHISKTDR